MSCIFDRRKAEDQVLNVGVYGSSPCLGMSARIPRLSSLFLRGKITFYSKLLLACGVTTTDIYGTLQIQEKKRVVKSLYNFCVFLKKVPVFIGRKVVNPPPVFSRFFAFLKSSFFCNDLRRILGAVVAEWTNADKTGSSPVISDSLAGMVAETPTTAEAAGSNPVHCPYKVYLVPTIDCTRPVIWRAKPWGNGGCS